jgi:DNA-binding IclR family transcriptional regulator
MQTDRDKILQALAEKPLAVFALMQRSNIRNSEECQQLLLKMREDGAVKFDIKSGKWRKA